MFLEKVSPSVAVASSYISPLIKATSPDKVSPNPGYGSASSEVLHVLKARGWLLRVGVMCSLQRAVRRDRVGCLLQGY